MPWGLNTGFPLNDILDSLNHMFKNLPTYCSLFLLFIISSIFNEAILVDNTKYSLMIY